MFSNIPKNLLPKFKPTSRIPKDVKKIINETISNPKFIDNSNIGYNFKKLNNQMSSFNNKAVIAKYYNNSTWDLNEKLSSYQYAKYKWEKVSFDEKKEIFTKTADLIENKYYDTMLAYTILSQNKTIYEAEIDSICELVDFLRFNIHYAENINSKQPISEENVKNISQYNSLNGFVTSITPFNFTAIGGNLASAPLLFSNSVFWKPSDKSILSNYLFYQIMLEAGLPKDILHFILMDGEKFNRITTSHRDFAGLLFTGSSSVFTNISKNIYKNLDGFRNYPRLVGETGGKNFHFIAPDYQNIKNVVDKTIASAFGYSGQKCSACSIVFVPSDKLIEFNKELNLQTDKFIRQTENYGVISNDSFKKLDNNLNQFDNDITLVNVLEGKNDDSNSWFIHPHAYVGSNLTNRIFQEEFFGPILAIYPYEKDDLHDLTKQINSYNNYALTASIFSNEEDYIKNLTFAFRHKAGNFYINDKSTGSVVGQQPFGGSGKSGTNDKAGDINLLFKLFNQRNIKISL